MNGVEKPGASELPWNVAIYPYTGIQAARKLFECVRVGACLRRMDQVIVHVGCMNLKESQELVSHIFIYCRSTGVNGRGSSLSHLRLYYAEMATLHNL